MVAARVFRWTDGDFNEEQTAETANPIVRAVDSWLVVDGHAVGIDQHRRRFAQSPGLETVTKDLDSFLDAALNAVPSTGRWFPRVEALGKDGQTVLRLHVRPAPDELTHVTLATAPRDPRTSPNTKGPDLVELGALRTELDVGEAVILDNGVIAEGAWSSIVWWKNDTLHAVDPSVPRLQSVTESILRQHASFIGAPVISARVRPDELDGAEVWVLSALHGIRVATEWRDGPALHSEPGRVGYWRQQYLNQRQVISDI